MPTNLAEMLAWVLAWVQAAEGHHAMHPSQTAPWEVTARWYSMSEVGLELTVSVSVPVSARMRVASGGWGKSASPHRAYACPAQPR